MLSQYNGKVAVITGGAHGLGEALATDLAGRKCHLALVDTDRVGLEEVRAKLLPSGVDISLHCADVDSEPTIRKVAGEVQASHGTVHLLINNAAVSASVPFADMAGTDFERVMRVNLNGVVYGCRAFLPFLLKHAAGQILNVASCFAWLGFPGKTAYASSKGAVRSFSESLRMELASQGVGVTILYPGPLDTGLVRDGISDSESRRNREQQLLIRRGLPLERVARRCLDKLLANPGRIVLGRDYLLLDAIARLSPALGARAMAVAAGRVGFYAATRQRLRATRLVHWRR